MAQLQLIGGPGFGAGIEYNTSNGRATAAYCQNNTAGPLTFRVECGNFNEIVTAPIGLTTRNLPANVLTITIKPDGGYSADTDFLVEVMD